MILLIDNYDSFTYNLFQQISGLGYDVTVVKNDQINVATVRRMNPSHIIISPGPKTPRDSGVSLDVIREFYTTTPILGICLGHQCLGEVFGVRTVAAKTIVHGKRDSVNHNNEGIFKDIPNPFTAARYHSLMIENVPDDFRLTAWADDNTIMGIAHSTYPVFGVQFHPESFMTEYGETLMRNFLACR
jgi:anthranilate synthase component 2